MRAGSLEDREPVPCGPDDEPVARVGYVAFVASGPLAAEAVHVVVLFERLDGLRRVEEDEVDELVERLKVDVLLLEPFRVALELGGVVGRQPHG